MAIEYDGGGRIRTAPPISKDAVDFIRVAGWAAALAGIGLGAYLLYQMPEGPSDITLRYRGEDPAIQLSRAVRMFYLTIGLGNIIGGVITGVLFNLMAGIGRGVSELWASQMVEKSEKESPPNVV